MANSSDEEADSRTASVGIPRARANPRSTSRSASNDSNSRPAKRQRRSQNTKNSDLSDFVPRGATFSERPLPVDPDSTSSSGSSSDSSNGDSEDADSDSNSQPDTTSANPHEGNTTPAISWNQGRKAAVRTTLGKRPAPNGTTTQFTAVNDRYWRSRSESTSPAPPGAEEPQGEEVNANEQSGDEEELEEGEIDSKSESDDSDSLDSEADDSILLNIGDKMDGVDSGNDYDPATLALQHASNNTNGNGTSFGSPSKEEAFRQFSRKYPTAPTSLIDLNQHDLELQAKYVHFDKNIHDLDLRLPVSCIECQREGHMADVCPFKECEHCNAWNQHQGSTCPTWRRCQRCRERGHDEPQCESKLRNFPSEVPCDYCGNEHLESECDRLWKSPSQETHSQQVTVSICCSNCCSMKHLAGDCESSGTRRSVNLSSSSFSLKGIDPYMITNLNSVGESRNGPPSSRGRPGSRARRDWSPPSSPDDDDMMSRVSRGNGRPATAAPRGNTRGNIKFGNGVGSNRGDSRSRGPSRGRSPFSGNGNGNGQRSLDPPPLPRGPPPRGPPPPRGGRGRGASRGPSRGGFSRGPRGPGRGRSRG